MLFFPPLCVTDITRARLLAKCLACKAGMKINTRPCCCCTPWIRCRHWSLPGRGCYRRLPLAIFAYRTAFDRVCPRHLVRDIHATLCIDVHHRLWFCLRPTKVCTVLRMQTFFLGFPWYTFKVASLQHFGVEWRGNSRFCLPMVPTRLCNTTI